VKDDAAAAHPAQLLHRPLVVAGLAQRRAVEVGDLVRADHGRLGVARRHRTGLRQRQPPRQRGRRFARQRRLVHFGCGDLEAQPQA